MLTTLDVFPLCGFGRKIQRVMRFVSMEPATPAEAQRLFSEWLSKKDAERFTALRQCISDCGGHLRSLSALYEAWVQHVGSSGPGPAEYHVLLSELLTALRGKVIPAIRVEHVQAALARAEVFLRHSAALQPVPAYEDQVIFRLIREVISWNDCSAAGFLTNTVMPNQATIVPTVTILSLLRWIAEIKKGRAWLEESDDGSPSKKTRKDYRVALADGLARLFAARSNFTWQQFEQWHPRWEALYRTAFAGTTTDLYSFYFPGCAAPKGLPRVLSELTRLHMKPHGVVGLPHQFALTAKRDDWPCDLCEAVFVPAAGNPGFDAVVFEKTCKGGAASHVRSLAATLSLTRFAQSRWPCASSAGSRSRMRARPNRSLRWKRTAALP